VLAPGTLLNVSNGLRVDFLGDDAATGSDAAGGADTEPTAAGADIGNGAAGFQAQQIHDAVDLEAFVAARLLEDAEVAGIRCAGWVRGRCLRPNDWRAKKQDREKSDEQLVALGHMAKTRATGSAHIVDSGPRKCHAPWAHTLMLSAASS
jgi:hypothetical protein